MSDSSDNTVKPGRWKTAVEFLEELFRPCTEGGVWIARVSNREASSPDLPEKHCLIPLSKIAERVPRVLRDYDRQGFATYFAVSTVALGSGNRNLQTIAQSAFAHVDIDLKEIGLDLDEVLARLLSQDRPPSVIVATGNGAHAYWLLDAPASPGDVRPILQKLARSFGADQSVAHGASYLRLVGSHNTKRGEWKLVEIVHWSERRYSLQELTDWQPGIVIAKMGALAEAPNPWLQAAEEVNFTPPLDVDERLADMRRHGTDEQAIHNTKLQVVAALLERGWELDDAVAKVLGAVMEAIGDTEVWDWAKEERLIWKMGDDWLRKRARRQK